MGASKGPETKDKTATAGKKTNPGNLPAPKPKQSHKLGPVAVQAIIDLTLQGYSIKEIEQYILDNHGVTISEQMICLYRRKERARMLQAIEEDIAAARAAYPEMTLLVGRLGIIDAAVKKELKKKRMSGYAVASLVATANQAIHGAESLRIRMRESLARYPEHKEGAEERVMQELERRSHVMRDVTESAEKIYEAAKDEFVIADPDKDLVIPGEVVEEPAAPDSPPEGAPVGLGEDALEA